MKRCILIWRNHYYLRHEIDGKINGREEIKCRGVLFDIRFRNSRLRWHQAIIVMKVSFSYLMEILESWATHVSRKTIGFNRVPEVLEVAGGMIGILGSFLFGFHVWLVGLVSIL